MSLLRRCRHHVSSGVAFTSIFAVVGMLTRVWHYALNYSLNHDDASLALNLLHRTATQLLQPLDYQQAAPLGFLLVERGMTVLFGGGEYTLRLVPLAASLLTVVAFWQLAAKTLTGVEVVIAVGFFSLSQALIDPAAAVKQYSTEILCAVLLLLVGRKLVADAPRRTDVMAAGLVGAIAVWFSFSAVFVMTGLTVAALLFPRRRLANWGRLLPAFALWGGSLLTAYALSIRQVLQNAALHAVWQPEFLPLRDPRAWPAWFARATNNLAEVAFAVRLAPFGAVCLVVAIGFAIARRNRFEIAMVSTLAITLMAACLQQYPFYGRFLFFAAPVAILLTCGTIGSVVRSHSTILQRLILLPACAALVYAGISVAIHQWLRGPAFDDPRGILTAVRSNWSPGDVIYASQQATPSLRYYQDRIGINDRDYVTVRRLSEYPDQFATFAAIPPGTRRVWFVYSWAFEPGLPMAVLRHYGIQGTRLLEIQRQLHDAVLYDIKRGN